jgi:hypothetical protein
MIAWAGHYVGAIQGEVSELIIFLATVSVISWVIVGATALLRFGVHMRYRGRTIQAKEAADQEPVS